jgi:transposase
MRPGRPKAELVLTGEEREALESLTRTSRRPAGLATRAAIVLACAAGDSNRAVAERLHVASVTVGKWRGRFVRQRLDGLLDEPRSGAPRRVTDEKVEDVITQTLEATLRGASHWSTRQIARHAGLSNATVSRIWRALGLQPHGVEASELSADPVQPRHAASSRKGHP